MKLSLLKDGNRNKILSYTIDYGDKPPLFFSQRLLLAFVGFSMFFELFSQRIAMSVAILCMTNQTAANLKNIEAGLIKNISIIKKTEQCSYQFENQSGSLLDGPFLWKKKEQGEILGAFFYGYLVSQIPGGLLAQQFGGKRVLAVSLSISTSATFLTPIASRLNYGFLIFIRTLCGLGSGTFFPAMHTLLGKWAPPLERTTLCGFSYSGSTLGNVVGLTLSGYLCEYGFSQRWDSIFYVFGFSSVIVLVIWCLFTTETPDSHPRISEREKRYIVESLSSHTLKNAEIMSVPWKDMLTSKAVWAIILSNFATDWGFYTYLTLLPLFYKDVLFFDISSNVLLSALPFLCLWPVVNFVPLLVDAIQARNMLSRIHTRKLFNTIGLTFPAFLLIGLSYLDCNHSALAVVMFTSAVSISGCVYSGFMVNHMDIAPQYAGTLMGIANGISASPGFIIPNLAAALTHDGSRESWQKVFFITAGVYIAGAISFLLFASTEIQLWARSRQPNTLDLIENDIRIMTNNTGVEES